MKMSATVFSALLVAWALSASRAPAVDDTAKESDLNPASGAATAPVPLYSGSYALILAASDYTQGWPDLEGVLRDVPVVRTALESHGFQVDVVQDPTRQQFYAAMDTFIGRHAQQEGNRIVVYYLGHGHSLPQTFGGDMGFVVPADAPRPDTNVGAFRSVAVPIDQFETWARLMQCRHALFVFDSCFSGSIFSSQTGPSRGLPLYIADKVQLPVRQFITSGDAYERVPDRSDFSPAFASGLEGEADQNNDGYVSGVELGEFLYERVVVASNRNQHPQRGTIKAFGLDQGDIVFQMAAANRASVPLVTGQAEKYRRDATDDFVIAVMPFYGALPQSSQDGLVIKQLVERQLYDYLCDAPGVRVQTTGADLPVRSEEEARRAGRAMGASVVIWGEVMALRDENDIQPYVTRMPAFERLRRKSRQVEPARQTPNRDAISYSRLRAASAANIAMLQAADYYQYINAPKALALAKRVAPQDAESLRLQATIYLNTNHDKEALECAQTALALEPDDVYLHVLLARILVIMGKHQRADEGLKVAQASFPNSPLLLYQRGHIAYNLGDYVAAFKFYEEGLGKPAGDSPEDHMRVGLVLDRIGRYEESLQHYQRAAAMDSGSAEPIFWSAKVYHALRDDKEALRRTEAAWQMVQRVDIGNQLGGLRLAGGDYEGAISILQDVLKKAPADVYVVQNLANALTLQGRNEEALRLLDDALAQASDPGQLRLFLHLALCRAGRQKEAVTRMQEYSRDKKANDVTSLLAELYAGRLDEATLVRKAKAKDAYGDRLYQCELHYFLGMAYLLGASNKLQYSAPDTARAIEHFEACLSTEIYKFIEYDYAKAELHKLRAPR